MADDINISYSFQTGVAAQLTEEELLMSVNPVIGEFSTALAA